MINTQVHQMQISADLIADRLLLRIATQAKEEIRVHVTRRFLRQLWPGLNTLLKEHMQQRPGLPSAETAGNPASQPPSFDQPYQSDNLRHPLGSTPLLVSEAQLEAINDGLCRMTLGEQKERSFTMTLNADLMQALCSMLRAAAEQAQWDLSLTHQEATPNTAGKMIITPPTQRLH